MCKHEVKKSPFLIRYVLDQFNTQKMWDKAILEIGGTSESVPNCYKIQEICNKAADKYPHALNLVLKCYITRKMCDKAVNTHPSTIQFVPECYKT